MSQKTVIGAIIVAVALVVITTFGAIALSNLTEPLVSSSNTSQQSQIETQSQTIQTISEPKYIVGAYGDNIAVFYYGEISPYEILSSRLSTFPPSDQEALKKGIPVESDEKLQSLLEDYSE